MTSGTYGRRSSISSESAALQSSLGNRLRQVTSILGSSLYKMTWKAWDTGSGRSRSRLRASAPRISETGRSGWPTPTVGNSMGSQSFEGLSATGRTPDGRKVAVSLNHVASLAGWPTPIASDGDKLDACPPAIERREKTGREIGLAMVARMSSPHGWADLGITPNGFTAGTVSGGQLNPEHSRWLMGLPVEWGHSMLGYWDWQMWQGLMQLASEEPSPTE